MNNLNNKMFKELMLMAQSINAARVKNIDRLNIFVFGEPFMSLQVLITALHRMSHEQNKKQNNK